MDDHLILDCSLPWVTETMKSEAPNNGILLWSILRNSDSNREIIAKEKGRTKEGFAWEVRGNSLYYF